MNDLQVFQDNLLKEIAADFAIKTWADFQRRFLMGDGKSPNTYKNYLTTCKQFYDFRGGLHPMQDASPEWVEQFYDSLPPDLNTRCNKMAGLKFMYKRISEKYPMFENPFNTMNEGLKQKIGRTKRDESEKDALTEKEYNGLLAMLNRQIRWHHAGEIAHTKAVQNYAVIRFGCTGGLRAAEMVNLKWENISETDGTYKATFIGKGSKVRTIQLERQAYDAILKAFRVTRGRKPAPDDYVFQGLPTGRPTEHAGISKSCIHTRIKQIIDSGRVEGIVRANLNVSTHTMRHTCATHLLAAGVDIETVRKHLGHSNVSTTMRYLHNNVDLTDYFAKIHGEVA